MENFKINKICGSALPLRGDSIDTDRIYPARFLRTVTFAGAEQHLFADDRQTDKLHPFNQSEFDDAKILLVETNFGGGSSREHAPQALKRRGLQAVVGISFGEIFFFNSVAIGLPCLAIGAGEAKFLIQTVEINPGAEIEIDLENSTIEIENKTFAFALEESARQQFLQGTWNSTLTLLQAGDLIEKTAGRLPYE